MKQKTILFRNENDFIGQVMQLKASPLYAKAKHTFLQIAVTRPDIALIQKIQAATQELLENVCVLGLTSGSIVPAPPEEQPCSATFCFLNQSEFTFVEYDFEKTNIEDCSKDLFTKIKQTKDIQGVLIFASGTEHNLARFIALSGDTNTNLPLFGAVAGLPQGSKAAPLVFAQSIHTAGAVILLLQGKDLHIRAMTSFGWQPLGKELEISGTEGPLCVTSIDDMPASYIYEMYLHVKAQASEQFLSSVNEFPMLLTERYGILQARIPLRYDNDGKLYFDADIHLGEKIRLTYGNIRHIFSESRSNSNQLYKFGTEALFLYNSISRTAYLKNATQKELSYFRAVCPDMFTCSGTGEIMQQQTGGLLNASLVAVSMHEGAVEHPTTDINPPEQMEPVNLTAPISPRLISFLETTNKEMKETSEAKSHFLSNMSHEIRTPINAVLGLDEMILRESTEPTIKSYAQDIQRSGKMLLSLINDILDFSKIEANKLDIIPGEYDLSNVISDLVNMTHPSIQRKGLDFSVQVESTIPHRLYGDEQRIKQCILNILSNAVKYTEQGSVTFTLQAKKKDDEHILLSVHVIDTGIGIKKTDLQKLFLPFERIEESRNRSIEGTGLGMSIVKGLLAKMGSRLIVKSEYGHGSDFSFTVEQKVCDWAPIGNWRNMQTEVNKNISRYKESFQAPNAHILVIDDMETNLAVIRGLLKTTHIQIQTAASAKEALALAEKNAYDLLLVDHLMPGMDGIEMLHQLRKNKAAKCCDVPCIALTANAISGAKEMYIKEGFLGYLSKPVSGEELEKALRTYLPKDLLIFPGQPGFVDSAPTNEATEEKKNKTTVPKAQGSAYGEEAAALLSELFQLDINTALKNCGTREVFLQATDTFRAGILERASLIERYAAEGNLKEYTVQVHGLKASAKLIGLTQLAQDASHLEDCGGKGNTDEIAAKTPALLDLYRSYVKTLSPLCKTPVAE